MKALLRRADPTETNIAIDSDGDSFSFDAFVGAACPSDMAKFLLSYKFGPTTKDQKDLLLVLEYISGIHGDPEIQRWLVISPQSVGESNGSWLVPGWGFSIRRRERVGDGQKRYNVFTESRHVIAAKVLTGISKSAKPSNLSTQNCFCPARQQCSSIQYYLAQRLNKVRFLPWASRYYSQITRCDVALGMAFNPKTAQPT